jgi:hypothetical protein
MLHSFEDSGKTEGEIREAVCGLRDIVQREQVHTPAESNAAFIECLRRALHRVNKAHANDTLSNNSSASSTNSSPFRTIDSSNDNAPTEPQGKKRALTEVDDKDYSTRRRKIESVVRLPADIMAMVISETLAAESRCAVDIIVPEWKICHKVDPELKRPLMNTRIVTYTRGIDGKVVPLHIIVNMETRTTYSPL